VRFQDLYFRSFTDVDEGESKLQVQTSRRSSAHVYCCGKSTLLNRRLGQHFTASVFLQDFATHSTRTVVEARRIIELSSSLLSLLSK
jgi:hypothetical protein